jgi:hypothetical protein
MLVEPDLLTRHLAALRAEPDTCFLGRIVSLPIRHPFSRMRAYIYDGPRTTLPYREPTALDCWTGHLSLRRDIYTNLGGFDDSLGDWGAEDLEFGLRLALTGVSLRLLEGAISRHRLEGRFREGLRRAYRNGMALACVASRYPQIDLGLGRPRHGRLLLGAIEVVSWILALALEPFDRGDSTPFAPLARAYEVGLSAARDRGLVDFARLRCLPT